MDSIDNREKIKQLAQAMGKYPQAILPTYHNFADGMYCRSMFMPVNHVVVGKPHKREHFFIVCYGLLQVTFGGQVAQYKSGDVIISEAGTQRAIVSLEDSFFLNVHRTDKTDLDEIELELIEPCEYSLFDSSNNLKALE